MKKQELKLIKERIAFLQSKIESYHSIQRFYLIAITFILLLLLILWI